MSNESTMIQLLISA